MQINHIFTACEGEGKEIGIMKTFVRCQGCSVGCKFCDTLNALNPLGGVSMIIPEIVKRIKVLKWPRITITGGEPLIQPDLIKLLWVLREEYSVSLETSGQLYDENVFNCCDFLSVDVKTPSSEVKIDWNIHHKILENFPFKTQIKAVMKTEADFNFIRKYYNKFLKKELLLMPFQLIITPCWEVKQQSFNVEFVKSILSRIQREKMLVRLILQQHKIIYGAKKLNA